MENKKITIRYLLNEGGRKKSLLQGGNGREIQEIITSATKELVELAKVDKNGDISLDIGFVENNFKQISECVIGLKIQESCSYARLIDVCEIVRFDEPQSVENLTRWEKDRNNRIIQTRKKLTPVVEKMSLDIKEQSRISQENYKANARREEEERKAKIEFHNKEEAKRKAKMEELEQEKINWIKEYGSPFLKDSMDLGYRSHKAYVFERAALEFPSFMIDFYHNARWKKNDEPSVKAIKEVLNLKKKGYNAIIVNLEKEPHDENDEDDVNYYFEADEFDGTTEAIVIEHFLDKYDLIDEI